MMREWSEEISRAPVRLFTPLPAIRALRPATIDFLLAQDSADGYLEFLAPGGEVLKKLPVRRRRRETRA